MAMTAEVVDHNDIGLRVEGDLGDLQIIDESSDDETNTISDIARLPGDLIKQSDTSKLSSIIVKDSENVQIGNNTYFNGPVVIKQVVQTGNGFDNAAYVKSDNENVKTNPPSPQVNDEKTRLKLWHKVSLCTAGVILVTGVCAIAIVTQQESSGPSLSQAESDLPTNHPTVTELCYGNWPLPLVLIMILSIPISLLLIYCRSLLIQGKGVLANNTMIEHTKYQPAGNQVSRQGHLRMVERNEWLAQPVVDKLTPLSLPAPFVIITHTASESCHKQSDCVYRVRLIQAFHVESRHWFDIGYNFLIGGEGNVYVGRGWDSEGAHTKGYNLYSIGIALIGTFNVESPTKHQMDACKKLIDLGVKLGKIAKDYKLFPHNAFWSTISPGNAVIDIIKHWPHYVNESEYSDISELLPKS